MAGGELVAAAEGLAADADKAAGQIGESTAALFEKTADNEESNLANTLSNEASTAQNITRIASTGEKTVEQSSADVEPAADTLAGAGEPPAASTTALPGASAPGPASVPEPKLGTTDPLAESTPPAARPTGADPVDLVTGEMLLTQRDLVLPGLLPLVFERVHLSNYRKGRWFGRSWASTLDQRVQTDMEGVHFAGPDGVVLHYPNPWEPGETVLADEGARWPLTWDRMTDTIRIEQPETGRTLYFPPGPTPRIARPLAAVSDRNGNRITIVHDEYGVPTEVFHSGGYHVYIDSIPTSAGSRIAALRPDHTPGAAAVAFRYDPRGRLTDVVNSSGLPLVFEYDDEDRITSWTNRAGRSYQYHYDESGRVASTGGTGGFLAATFAYDLVAKRTTMTNSLGHETVYTWNNLNQVVQVVDPLGAVTTMEQDRYGRLLVRTDPLGRTARFIRDEHGNPTRIGRPDGSEILVEYNALRLPASVLSPSGNLWQYTYDERGNLLAATDPAGAVTRYEYTGSGALSTVTDALGQVTRYESDAAGLPVGALNALGAQTRLERDGSGRICTLADALGGVARMGWTAEGALAWRVAVDGAREDWTYDADGNLLEHRDPCGGTTNFEYGPFGKPVARTDPSGARYEFTYDTQLRMTSVTNPAGSVWRYDYDAAGKLVSETDFNGRVLNYGYDPAGRLIARVNGAGQATIFVRDVLGRVIERRLSDMSFRFAYDPEGRVVFAQGPDGTLTYTRDALGRILAESADGRTLTYDYDTTGRRVRRTTPTGAVSEWTYDAVGLPASLATSGGGLAFQHDALGRETTRYLGPCAALSQSFDPAGRLTGQAIWAYDQIEPADAATANTDPETGTDTAAARTHQSLQQRAYAYRPDGFPVKAGDQLRGIREFELNAAGMVTTVSAATWTETYLYDTLGNLTHAVTPDGGADEDAQGEREHTGTVLRRAGRTTYEHDAQGRVVRTIRRTLSGQTREYHFSWTADDRLTQAITPDGSIWRYAYDPLGRRTAKRRLADDGTVLEETWFTWDGTRLAEQASITADGQAHVTTWDWEPGSHRAAAQTQRSWATDAPQAEIDIAFYAIVTDPVGAPAELVTPDGRIAWRQTTSLWGVPLRASGAPNVIDTPDTPNAPDTDNGPSTDDGPSTDNGLATAELHCPLRFPGQYHDAETGLNYNYQRYYDPTIARYLTPDPLQLAPAPNNYAYVPNPGRSADPLGLDPQDSPSDNNNLTVYRYGDRTNPYELQPKLASAPPDVQAQVAANMTDPVWAATRAEDHMQGDTANTPFISVAGDYHAAAATTDPWLHDITRQAPDLATFRVPTDRLVMPRNPLSISETEMLFNGSDLANFLVTWDANPYLGLP